MRADPDITAIAHALVNQAKRTNPRPLEALPGGRNNRVFRLATDQSPTLLKLYFHHPDDSRDRLRNEFGFLEHLQAGGSKLAATPLAKDPANFAGLMEFIEGDRLGIDQVTAAEVEQATEFFIEANAHRTSPFAQSLPNASEACFSMAEHLATTQRRVDRLDRIGGNDDLDVAVLDFVAETLLRLWQTIRSRVESDTGELELALPIECRVLSPSDFGFHNALRESSGRLRFLDFEFAGWDDPAKLICDFRNQPDMLLDRSLTDIFTRVVIDANPARSALEQRVSLLEPVYQVKWACICLNDFLDWGKQRKQFTSGNPSSVEIRTAQLAKARVMIERAQSLMKI